LPATGEQVAIPILFQSSKWKLTEVEVYDGEGKFTKTGAVKIDLIPY
jgi:hypothetical protein